MKRVFIIEDDDDLRSLLQLCFRNSGFEIRTYASAHQFLQDDTVADLYLIDVNLPGIDGLQLCKQLKTESKTKDKPVIMISANPDIAIMAREVCADDYIQKPFTLKQVQDKTQFILERYMR